MKGFCFSIMFLASISSMCQSPLIRTDSLLLPIVLSTNGSQVIVNQGQLSDPKLQALLKVKKVYVDDADLLINYQLKKLNTKDRFNYQTKIYLYQEGKPITDSPQENWQGDIGKITQTDKDVYQFKIPDFTEYSESFFSTWKVAVECELYGFGLDCHNPPKVKNKWIHYTAGLAGLGLVALGGLEKTQFDHDIVEYRGLWDSNALQFQGDFVYNEAEKNRKNNRTLNFVGLGVLILDGIFLADVLLKHRHKAKLFKRFCQADQAANLHLSIVSNYGLAVNTPTVGAKLAWLLN